MAEFIAFPGTKPLDANVANSDLPPETQRVIGLLENAIAKARETKAMACAVTLTAPLGGGDDTWRQFCNGGGDPPSRIIGAVALLLHHIGACIQQDSTP